MELLKNNLPLISIYLLISAIVRLFSYYSFFNIDISSYIEVGEVIQLQFVFLTFSFVTSAIVSLLPLALLGVFIPDINKVKFPSIDKDEESMQFDIKDRNLTASQGLRGSIRFILKLIIVTVIYIFFIAFHFGLYNKPVYEALLIAFMAIPVLYAMKFCQQYMAKIFEGEGSRMSLRQRHKKQLLFYNKYLIILVLSILIVTEGLFARFSAFTTLTSHGEFNSVILLEDKKIVTNDTLVYVGKTKGYLFLYDKGKEDAVIYPTAKIKEIHFSEGKKSAIVPKFLRSRWYKEPLH